MAMTDEECMPFKTEWRWAQVMRIVDGDTFDLLIDLGFDVHTRSRVRLLGADTWEVRGEEREAGLKAKQRVLELIPPLTDVRIRSHKGGSRGKYGRWLVEVAYPVGDGWEHLGETLIKEGHAEEYK
jgi:micrococcal nuclease